MPYNFAVDSFHTKKLCSKLSSNEVRFYTEIGRFAFLRPPVGDVGATYDDHLRLIGKRRNFFGSFIPVVCLVTALVWYGSTETARRKCHNQKWRGGNCGTRFLWTAKTTFTATGGISTLFCAKLNCWSAYRPAIFVSAFRDQYINAIFKVSSFTLSRDMGSQNCKSRLRDHFPISFDLILHFSSLVPLVINIHAKFEVFSFTRSREMEGVPQFQK